MILFDVRWTTHHHPFNYMNSQSCHLNTMHLSRLDKYWYSTVQYSTHRTSQSGLFGEYHFYLFFLFFLTRLFMRVLTLWLSLPAEIDRHDLCIFFFFLSWQSKSDRALNEALASTLIVYCLTLFCSAMDNDRRRRHNRHILREH